MSNLKWDEDVVWRAELKNMHNAIVQVVEGPRELIESNVKTWIPILIEGDTINLTKVNISEVAQI